jgi:type I restriction enzyme R subunit
VTKNLNESTIEHHAIALFQELGYSYAFGPDIGPDNDQGERSDYGEVLLLARLRQAIQTLNPAVHKEIRAEALRHVQAVSHGGLLTENAAFQQMLVEGVRIAHHVDGEERGTIVRLLDYEHPEKNDFLVVNQYTVIHDRINRRADLVVFINGMPLGLFELKNMADANATIRKAWNQLQTYQADIPNLLAYNAVLVISDGLKAAMGCLGAPYERFLPWKTIDGQELMDRGDDPLRFLIHGIFEPHRFLSLLRYFISFENDGRRISKKIAAYHQFHAAHKALLTTLAAAGIGGDRRGGVVWHTQGSGKSLTMLFFAGMLIQHPALENPTIVMLTDRTDLDTQLFDTFAAGSSLLRQDPQQADSVSDLRELLQRASGGVIFSTIQKFQKDRHEPLGSHPVLSERKNIIVMVDEAQRSQYEILDGYAANLRTALPNATFVAFTGTPLELDDKDTRVVFGDYIDIYDIQRAVDDGATVPIFYESRLVRLNLPEDQRPVIDATFEEITEDDEQETRERIKTRWAQLEALVGAPKRVEQLAADILDHWDKRKNVLSGKAMIVAMSRRIAVDLYNAITKLRPEWHSPDDTQGAIKVVMTGTASDPIEWKAHIRSKAGNGHGRPSQRPRRSVRDRHRAGHVVDRFRCACPQHPVCGQAHARAHPHAGHRQRQPGIPRQVRRAGGGLYRHCPGPEKRHRHLHPFWWQGQTGRNGAGGHQGIAGKTRHLPKHFPWLRLSGLPDRRWVGKGRGLAEGYRIHPRAGTHGRRNQA